jgi:hypothetical protein
MTPTPSTATSYTFSNLSAGTYTIDVRDQFGCVGVQQNVTINPQLVANAVLTADLTCLAPATVDVNASGGSGTYTYEWSDDGGATYNNTNFVGNVFSTNTRWNLSIPGNGYHCANRLCGTNQFYYCKPCSNAGNQQCCPNQHPL